MNKTLITLGFLILILGAIVGDVVLAVVAPDQLAVFNGAVITILGVGTAGIVTIWGLGKQGQQLEQIKSQTNGTLSKLIETNEALQQENAELREERAATGTPPSNGAHVA